jgi:hypothetical protein
MNSKMKMLVLSAAMLVFLGGALPALAGELQTCKVELNKTKIKVQSEPVMLEATLPDAVPAGSVSQVQADVLSGLVVSIIDQAAEEGAQLAELSEADPESLNDLGDPVGPESERISLEVDSSRAKAGKWEIAFYVDGGVCKTMLTVEPTASAEVRR